MSESIVAVLDASPGEAPTRRWAALATDLATDPRVRQVIWRGPHPGIAPISKTSIAADGDLSAIFHEAAALPARVVLAFTTPVDMPLGLPARAIDLIEADPRNGVVSFLSDHADHTALFQEKRPGRSRRDATRAGLTAPRINELLRGDAETMALPRVVTQPGGWVHAISADAVRAFGRQPQCVAAATVDGMVCALAREFASRGLRSLLDASTYVQALSGTEQHPQVPGRESRADDCSDDLALARAKVFGLDVVIDGTCLGSHPNGTQVQIVELIQVLAKQPRLRSVGVAIADSTLPAYASQLDRLPKVTVRQCTGLDLSAFGPVDIIHRPFQTKSRPIRGPWGRWSTQGARTVYSLLDLISFSNPEYRQSTRWEKHRRSMGLDLECADMIVTISEDVAADLHLNGLPTPAARLRTVPLGTEHLSGSEGDQRPGPSPSDLDQTPFLAVIGTNLMHKNRDLAIAAWRLLRAQGHDSLRLVVAGRHVDRGSSAIREAFALQAGCGAEADFIDLGPVPSEERNWLLRHAAAVLYPTSAEGFGLVPFEAAVLGTPTVWVPFGPLRELLPDTAGTARSWAPEDLADAADALLTNREAAEAAVEAIRSAGAQLTWERTGAAMVDAYFDALAMPRRVPQLLAQTEMLAVRVKALRESAAVRQDLTTTPRRGKSRRGALRRLTRRLRPR